MKFSNQLQKVSGSVTAQVFAKAKQMERDGKTVYHLEIGQPDFIPPKVVLNATSQSILHGDTSYTVSNGIFELRDEISKYYSKLENTSLNPNSEVIVTAGGKIAIFAAIWSLVNPNDNVIIFNPSWVSYADMVTSFGAEPRFIVAGNNFDFDESLLRSKIDEKTKMIILCSPSNPTGDIISNSNLTKIVNIARENNIVILSDEIYNEYVYDQNKHVSLMSIKDWKENGIVVNGFAKTFSMTGYRLGFAMSNSSMVGALNKVMQLTTTCPVNFAQQAGIVAFQNIDLVKREFISIMEERRKLAYEIIKDYPFNYQNPKGAIYGWLGIPKATDSVKFCSDLLMETGVATTPGKAFGPAGEGFVRICLATNNEILTKGIELLGKYYDNY